MIEINVDVLKIWLELRYIIVRYVRMVLNGEETAAETERMTPMTATASYAQWVNGEIARIRRGI